MKYTDSSGNECTLLQLISREPEWAVNRMRQLEREETQADMVINAIDSVLDGEEVSDFELSFSIVRQASDMYLELKRLRGE